MVRRRRESKGRRGVSEKGVAGRGEAGMEVEERGIE